MREKQKEPDQRQKIENVPGVQDASGKIVEVSVQSQKLHQGADALGNEHPHFSHEEEEKAQGQAQDKGYHLIASKGGGKKPHAQKPRAHEEKPQVGSHRGSPIQFAQNSHGDRVGKSPQDHAQQKKDGGEEFSRQDLMLADRQGHQDLDRPRFD